MFIFIYAEKMTLDITKKLDAIMSVKRAQKTCVTEFKLLVPLSRET
jgi:hypothetical protein